MKKVFLELYMRSFKLGRITTMRLGWASRYQIPGQCDPLSWFIHNVWRTGRIGYVPQHLLPPYHQLFVTSKLKNGSMIRKTGIIGVQSTHWTIPSWRLTDFGPRRVKKRTKYDTIPEDLFLEDNAEFCRVRYQTWCVRWGHQIDSIDEVFHTSCIRRTKWPKEVAAKHPENTWTTCPLLFIADWMD